MPLASHAHRQRAQLTIYGLPQLISTTITYDLVSVLPVLPVLPDNDLIWRCAKDIATAFYVSTAGDVLSHPSIDFTLYCSKSVPNVMAQHLGATRGLDMRPPTIIPLPLPTDLMGLYPHASLRSTEPFSLRFSVYGRIIDKYSPEADPFLMILNLLVLRSL